MPSAEITKTKSVLPAVLFFVPAHRTSPGYELFLPQYWQNGARNEDLGMISILQFFVSVKQETR